MHGLHPHGVGTRVEAALESVRPYLGTHGGDVELVGVSDEGVVRLRLLGSCDGCPSSSVDAGAGRGGGVEAAAPEVRSIEVGAPTRPRRRGTGDPGRSLCGRPHRRSRATARRHGGSPCRRSRRWRRGGRRVRGRRRRRCWSAGSAATCSRSPTGAPVRVEHGRGAARAPAGRRGRVRRADAARGAAPTTTSGGPARRSTPMGRTWSRARCWSGTACCPSRRRADVPEQDGGRTCTTGAGPPLARCCAGSRAARRRVDDGERCEMCAEPIGDEHPHVVDLDSRALLCTCRACYLLFTDRAARSCATAPCPTATCRSRASRLGARAVGRRWRSRSGWRSSSATPCRPDRGVLPRPGRRHRVRAAAGGLGPVVAANPRAGHAAARRRGADRRATGGERRRSSATWCRSTAATSWSGAAPASGAGSTAARRRGRAWTRSSLGRRPVSRPLAQAGRR